MTSQAYPDLEKIAGPAPRLLLHCREMTVAKSLCVGAIVAPYPKDMLDFCKRACLQLP